MGTISSSIGLISGVPITDTVNQLIELEAQPRDRLLQRTQVLVNEQTAITQITAKLLTFQFQAKKFASEDLFQQLTIKSSDSSLISANVTGQPKAGSYQFTPVQRAQAQQLLSSAFTSDTTPIGSGTLKFRFGGEIDRGLDLGLLNGGEGIQRGKIRITDRSGASEEIDLRFVRSVDDVLDAVNNASNINVTLQAVGDRFELIDNTGQTTANLRVQEVSGGRTAADLGLAGIDVAADQAAGNDLIEISPTFTLDQLNDGRGIRTLTALPELEVTFRDGSLPLFLDFNRLETTGQFAAGTKIAANGETAQLTFRAKTKGSEFDGYAIAYVDDATAGNESLVYDTNAKTLVFHIEEGSTTADDIIRVLEEHSAASNDFEVEKTNGNLYASTSTGSDASTVLLTAKADGPDFDGFTISYVNDTTAGSETVEYDKISKTITFHIEEGATTAEDLIGVAAGNSLLTADFIVDVPARHATATTTAVGGIDAQVAFTAITAGSDFDDVEIVFVDNAGVTQGNETVVFDDTPGAKKLTFQIDAGQTTANDIVAALAADEDAAALFSASLVSGGSGTGVIDTGDTATTTGGANDGLVLSTDSGVTAGGLSGLISTADVITTSGGAAHEATSESRLSDLLASINEQGNGRLLAEINDSGTGIQITDLTEDLGGEFTISSIFDSHVLEDLGISGAAVDGVITGNRLIGGLKSPLLSSLAGGSGLSLGTITVTDRALNSTTIDLSAAETLDDVIETFNSEAASAGVNLELGINDLRKGLLVSDTSGATTGPLIVANSGDATLSADQLGIAVNDNVSEFSAANLNLQTVTENTLLSSLNGGAGIGSGQFRITSSTGAQSTISVSNLETVGDLIDEINSRGIAITARINDTGDGILLLDDQNGTGTLSVEDLFGGQVAARLHLAGTATSTVIDGQDVQTIEGGTSFTLEIDDDDTLDDLIEKFNSFNTGFTALKLGDGSFGNPFRFTVVGSQGGKEANLLIDDSQAGFSLNETVRAQDALLLFGAAETAGAGILVSSKNNTFNSILPGASLTLSGASTSPVVLSVEQTDSNLVSATEDLVASYNSLRDSIDEFTFFNPEDNSRGVLNGSGQTLRIENELSDLLTSRFFGVGDIQSLEQLGISINDKGRLTFDSTKLQATFTENPTGLKEFFTTETTGAAAKFDALIESLAGEDNSLLVSRGLSLSAKIDANNERAAFLTERLERKRELLLEQFVQMELAIGRMQNDLQAVNSIQAIAPLSFTSSSQ